MSSVTARALPNKIGPSETVIPLADIAPKSAEIFGVPVSLQTIRAWARRGVRGNILETRMIGGRRFTSLEACQRFLDATS